MELSDSKIICIGSDGTLKEIKDSKVNKIFDNADNTSLVRTRNIEASAFFSRLSQELIPLHSPVTNPSFSIFL